jgi:predicted metal-binding protein
MLKTMKELKEILPEFLYKNPFGVVTIGYHGDTPVEEEWNKYQKQLLIWHLEKQREMLDKVYTSENIHYKLREMKSHLTAEIEELKK